MIRIPIRPGVRLTFGGAPNPDAVKVTLAAGKPARVVRLVSKRGWMLLLVSYDWRKPTPTPEERLMSTPPTPDLPAEAAARVSPICEIPHGSIEEEDACEQQRLHDRANAPTATKESWAMPDTTPAARGLLRRLTRPDAFGFGGYGLSEADAQELIGTFAAAVRSAALREAAGAVDALIPALQREWPDEPANSPWCCGVKDAATELRRLAVAPTATGGE